MEINKRIVELYNKYLSSIGSTRSSEASYLVLAHSVMELKEELIKYHDVTKNQLETKDQEAPKKKQTKHESKDS